VQLFRAGSPYGNPQDLVGHDATFSAAPPVGANTFTARYLGDTNYDQSTSNQISHPVTTNSSSTDLSDSPNPSACNQRVTFTADVVGLALHGGVPTGTVTFFDGAVSLGTTDLTGAEATTFTPNLAPGASHDITATYNGDTNYDPSTSLAVTQAVNACTVPVATDDAYATPLSTQLTVADTGVLSNDSNVDPTVPDGAALQTVPGHGTVTLNPAGGFTYTPTSGFTGDDAFTYCVSGDPDLVNCDSNTATATITVGTPEPTTTIAPSTTIPPSTTTPTTVTSTTIPPTTTTTTLDATTTPTTGADAPLLTPAAAAAAVLAAEIARPADAATSTTVPTSALPRTGTDTTLLLEIAIAALCGGAVSIAAARRRRTHAAKS
jgi:hypothetical protein